MHRKTSKDRRYAKSHWTTNQKLEVVTKYLMLGSITQAAIVTGVPLQTIKTWKYTDWWKEYCLKLKTENIEELDANMQRIVSKSLKAVEDRIDFGDAQYDQRTGAIVRVPIKAHVALKISTDLLTKRDKIAEAPMKQEIEKTIDDRLLKLSEEFSKFAQLKSKAIDVEAIEIHQQ